MKTSVKEVLDTARSQLNVTEYPPDSNNVIYTRWFGNGAVGWPWCNIFVDWVLFVACHKSLEKSPLEGIDFAYGPAYTGDTMLAGQRKTNGLNWHDYPAVGDLVIYDWDWAGEIDHIGIISWVNPGDRNDFMAIEGNTSSSSAGSQSNGGGVFERRRRNDQGYVRGFVGVPYGSTPVTPPPVPGAPAWPGRYLALTSPNMSGTDVRQYQQRLKDRGWVLDTDGVFGPQTRDVTKAFQADKRLEIDGVVGKVTWDTAFRTDNVT